MTPTPPQHGRSRDSALGATSFDITVSPGHRCSTRGIAIGGKTLTATVPPELGLAISANDLRATDDALIMSTTWSPTRTTTMILRAGVAATSVTAALVGFTGPATALPVTRPPSSRPPSPASPAPAVPPSSTPRSYRNPGPANSVSACASRRTATSAARIASPYAGATWTPTAKTASHTRSTSAARYSKHRTA